MTIKRSRTWLLLLILLTVPTFYTLIRPGYFTMHDDMQAMRLLQIDKCVKDRQIPCRWVPDMGFGFGYPQFNYYSPLPYYTMEVIHLSGFSFLVSVKAFFVLSVILSAIGMFYLAKEYWGTYGAVVSGFLYAYVPYRAVDMYVRGAVGELAAFSVLPFVFLFAKKVIDGKRKNVLWFTLSLAALFTSHNISSVMILPFLGLYILLVFYLNSFEKKVVLGKIKDLFFSFVWGFAIAGFFVLPAWLEKKYVKIETLTGGYFDYHSHFVGLKQLLATTFWGYGVSQPGPYDQIFLGVGVLTWTLPILALGLLFYFKREKKLVSAGSFVILAFVSLFLIHPRSAFLWDNITLLSYFQFPWRFLLIASFLFSISVGSLGSLLPKNNKFNIFYILSLFSLISIFYASYFRPVEWLPITDEEKFSGASWQLQQTVSINDYLPVYASNAPKGEAPAGPIIAKGSAQIVEGNKGTNWQDWEIVVDGGQAIVMLPQYYFPGWKVYEKGHEIDVSHDNDLGLISFTLGEGDHQISAKLTNTPVRTFANWISLFGVFAIPLFLRKEKDGDKR